MYFYLPSPSLLRRLRTAQRSTRASNRAAGLATVHTILRHVPDLERHNTIGQEAPPVAVTPARCSQKSLNEQPGRMPAASLERLRPQRSRLTHLDRGCWNVEGPEVLTSYMMRLIASRGLTACVSKEDKVCISHYHSSHPYALPLATSLVPTLVILLCRYRLYRAARSIVAYGRLRSLSYGYMSAHKHPCRLCPEAEKALCPRALPFERRCRRPPRLEVLAVLAL